MGRPFAEYDRRDGDKALAADGCGHKLRQDGQGHGRPAKTCQGPRKDHAGIADLIDIDAQGVRRGGMFPDGPQVQAPGRPVKKDDHKDRDDQGDQGGHIHVEVIEASRQSMGKEPGDLVGDRRRLRSPVKNEPAHEEGKPRPHQVHGNTADRLIGLAGDGRKSMDQAEEGSRQARRHKSDPGIPGHIGHGRARKGPDRHHSLDPDVDDTGHLGNDAALGGKDQRGGIHESDPKQKQYSVRHLFLLSRPSRCPDPFLRDRQAFSFRPSLPSRTPPDGGSHRKGHRRRQ